VATSLRSAYRSSNNPDAHEGYIGFRLASTLPNAPSGIFPGGVKPTSLVEAKAQVYKNGDEITDCSDCPSLIVVPGGKYLMGSTSKDALGSSSVSTITSNVWTNETPQHLVEIKSFAIGKFEITKSQWVNIMGGATSSGNHFPIEVSLKDAENFIKKLSLKTGKSYRLPSEAEWEYAARSGGGTASGLEDDEAKVKDYAWYIKNSGGSPRDVGQKIPNRFGLFDVYGNVAEWVADCYHEDYSKAPVDGSAWVTDCRGDYLISRGGSAYSNAPELRSTFRKKYDPNIPNLYGNGFRIARDL